jgi:septum formation protein
MLRRMSKLRHASPSRAPVVRPMTDPPIGGSDRAIVLASSSPRRRILLGSLGVRFTVRISDLDETLTAPATPAAYVESLARQKAELVAWEAAPLEDDATDRPGSLVIGADTAVTLHGDILGKPADEAAAAAMLSRLRGRDHDVLTAVALVDTVSRAVESRVVTTTVHMRDFDDETMAAYIATGEPFDKAGGYGIQRGTRGLIAGFTGCYTNVVGLPLCEIAALLRGASIALGGEPPYCLLPDGRPCPHALTLGLEPGGPLMG